MTPQGITGIILAGGESRRMGTLKPLVEYRGKLLINWIFDALNPICRSILIIANSGDFSALGATVYPDNFPGNGPAAGIETGLSHCPTEIALVTSCDTPNLSTDLFKHLLKNQDGYDVTLASHNGFNEPLIGVYSRSVHPLFRSAILSGDPRPQRIIRQCKWHEVAISPDQSFYRTDLFLNLNTPLDLTR